MEQEFGRPFGQPALVASRPEPVPVSAHAGDGQAQGAAKREFKNELGRDILAGVEIGRHPDSYCRLYIYGPDSGIDSYVTRRELAELRSAINEVFDA